MVNILRKPLVLVGVVLVCGAVAWVIVARRGSSSPAFETLRVERRTIVREVDVTGTVTPTEDVSLAFEVGGRIVRVNADVGDRIASSAIVVALDDTDLRAQYAQASASLAEARAKLAELRVGTRPEEVRVKEADRENAQRALLDAERSASNVATKAAADLDAHYENARNVLRSAYTKADDAVRKQTDEFFSNDATANPQLTFQTSAPQAEIDAEAQRRAVEELLVAWPPMLSNLASASSQELDELLLDMASDLDHIRMFLERVNAAVNSATNIAQATINAYKVSVATARGNVNDERTTIDNLRQTIAAQRVTNRNAVDAADADRTVKQNARDAADAALALVRAGATEEQIAAAGALVAKAEAAIAEVDAKLAKTTLRAPFAGVLTVSHATVGAIAIAGTPLISIISDAAFDVEANVPEVDLSGLVVGRPANITLDAYGADTVFAAKVSAIDPAATIVEGVPTYRTTLSFTARDERIRAGMTADATIEFDRREDVLAIPQRALIRRDRTTMVRVLRNGEAHDVPVVVGLRGSDGFVEIVSGLTEGDEVIRP